MKYLTLAGLFFFLQTQFAIAQVTSWNFDFDDNVLYMPTKIVLFHKTTDTEIEISTREYALERNAIGVSGKYKNYEIRPHEPLLEHNSYRYFRDSSHANYFLDDLKQAVALRHYGPAWDAFVFALSHPRTAARTTIITARGQSPTTLHAGLIYLRDLGLIKYVPLLEHIYPTDYLFRTNHPTLGTSTLDMSAIKLNVIKHELDLVQNNEPLEPVHDVISRDGKGLASMHVWGFSDDDFSTFERTVKAVSDEVKNGRWPDIKIVIYFTGQKHSVHPPHGVVLTSNGNTRKLLPGEHKEAHKIAVFQQCRDLLKP